MTKVAESNSPPAAPVWVRLLLLLLLPLFALLLFLDGQDDDPGLLDLQPKTGMGSVGRDPFPPRLAGLDRNGQARSFGADDLYEYINGHADYFIGAGFETLRVGEYGSDGGGAPRLVINLYGMGSGLNAFGVLVEEAGERPAVEVGDLGFRSGSGVSFVRGPYYVQVSPFDPAVDGLRAARELASTLDRGAAGTPPAFHFPAFGTPVATRFVREYYRGMDALNRVLERTFEREGDRFDAFLLTGSGEEIEATVQALIGFLSEDGIPFVRVERNGLGFYRVEDAYEGEWFFVPLPGSLLGAYAPLDDRLARAVAAFHAAGP